MCLCPLTSYDIVIVHSGQRKPDYITSSCKIRKHRCAARSRLAASRQPCFWYLSVLCVHLCRRRTSVVSGQIGDAETLRQTTTTTHPKRSMCALNPAYFGAGYLRESQTIMAVSDLHGFFRECTYDLDFESTPPPNEQIENLQLKSFCSILGGSFAVRCQQLCSKARYLRNENDGLLRNEFVPCFVQCLYGVL